MVLQSGNGVMDISYSSFHHGDAVAGEFFWFHILIIFLFAFIFQLIFLSIWTIKLDVAFLTFFNFFLTNLFQFTFVRIVLTWDLVITVHGVM